ncbi:hypothetical protein ACO0QE_001673 [Hanseniaspora vineae]
MSLELIRLTSFYSDDLISGIRLLQSKIEKDVDELEYYLHTYDDIKAKVLEPLKENLHIAFQSSLTNSVATSNESRTNLSTSFNTAGQSRSVVIKGVVSGIKSRILSGDKTNGHVNSNTNSRSRASSQGNGFQLTSSKTKNHKSLLYDNGEVPIGVQLSELKLNELRTMYQDFIDKFQEALPLLQENGSEHASRSEFETGEEKNDALVELIDDLQLLKTEKIGIILMDCYQGIFDASKSLDNAIFEYTQSGKNFVEDPEKASASNGSETETITFPLVFTKQFTISNNDQLNQFKEQIHKLAKQEMFVIPNSAKNISIHSESGVLMTADDELLILGKKLLEYVAQVLNHCEIDFNPNIIEIEQLFQKLTFCGVIGLFEITHKSELDGYQAFKYYKFNMGINVEKESKQQNQRCSAICENYETFIDLYIGYIKVFHQCMIDYNDIFMRKLMKINELFGEKTEKDGVFISKPLDYLKEMESLYIANTTTMMSNVGNFQYFGSYLTKLSITLLEQEQLENGKFFSYKEYLIEPVLHKLNSELDKYDESANGVGIDGITLLDIWFKNDINEVTKVLKMKQYLVKMVLQNANPNLEDKIKTKFIEREIDRNEDINHYHRLVNILKNYLMEIQLIKYIQGLETTDFSKIIQFMTLYNLQILVSLIKHFDLILQKIGYDIDLIQSYLDNNYNNEINTNIVLFSQLFFKNSNFADLKNLNVLIREILFENKYYEIITQRIESLEKEQQKAANLKSADTDKTDFSYPSLEIKKRTNRQTPATPNDESSTSSNSTKAFSRNSRMFLSAIQRKLSDSILPEYKKEGSAGASNNREGKGETKAKGHLSSKYRSRSSTASSSLSRTSHPELREDEDENDFEPQMNSGAPHQKSADISHSSFSYTEDEFVPRAYKRLSSLPLPSESSSPLMSGGTFNGSFLADGNDSHSIISSSTNASKTPSPRQSGQMVRNNKRRSGINLLK